MADTATPAIPAPVDPPLDVDTLFEPVVAGYGPFGVIPPSIDLMALSATSASAITVVKNCSSTVTKAPSLSGDNAVASDGDGVVTGFTTLIIDFRSRHVTVPRESTTTSMYANPIDDSMRVGILFKYSVGPGPGPNGTQLMGLAMGSLLSWAPRAASPVLLKLGEAV